MKRITETKMLLGKPYVTVREAREYWYEWFVVPVDEGMMCPRFFLPVRRYRDRMQYEAWVFPLAPFVVLGLMANSAFWAVWSDLVDLLFTLEKYRQRKG